MKSTLFAGIWRMISIQSPSAMLLMNRF